MDETYIRVKGEWRYLYRAVEISTGRRLTFLLTESRDQEAALRFLKKAIRRNGVPETITIDGSDANEAAIKSYNHEPWYGVTPVNRDRLGTPFRRIAFLRNRNAASWSRLSVSRKSTVSPYLSTARYRYRHSPFTRI